MNSHTHSQHFVAQHGWSTCNVTEWCLPGFHNPWRVPTQQPIFLVNYTQIQEKKSIRSRWGAHRAPTPRYMQHITTWQQRYKKKPNPGNHLIYYYTSSWRFSCSVILSVFLYLVRSPLCASNLAANEEWRMWRGAGWVVQNSFSLLRSGGFTVASAEHKTSVQPNTPLSFTVFGAPVPHCTHLITQINWQICIEHCAMEMYIAFDAHAVQMHTNTPSVNFLYLIHALNSGVRMAWCDGGSSSNTMALLNSF